MAAGPFFLILRAWDPRTGPAIAPTDKPAKKCRYLITTRATLSIALSEINCANVAKLIHCATRKYYTPYATDGHEISVLGACGIHAVASPAPQRRIIILIMFLQTNTF